MISGGHVVLGCADLNKAVRFYVETLGMKLVDDTHAAAGTMTLDAGDGFRLVLQTGAGRIAGCVGLEARGDFDTTVTVYANRGIAFAENSDSVVRRADFTDPEGNALYLWKAR
jgi:catechol 2,3-dioxygenase-like lactoylglutathione lyase family enzyme